MVPLFKPYISQNLNELDTILDSGNLAYGDYGKELEYELESFLGAKNVVIFNTYNSAWQALLKALEPSKKHVLAPAFACAASIQPFATEGYEIKWLDLDKESGQCQLPTPAELADSSIILVGHNCGYLSNVEEFENLNKLGCTVIHDGIEAFGSKWDDKYLGNSDITSISIFSTDTVRILNTVTGGFISCRDDALAMKLRLIRDYGIERRYYRDEFGEIRSDYDIASVGFGSKPSEINSYIGLKCLEEVPRILAHHKRNAEFWKDELIRYGIPFKELSILERSSPNYWVYGFTTQSKELFREILAKNGYQSSGVHAIVSRNSVFRNPKLLNGAEAFNSSFLAVPTGWWFEF